MYESHFTVEPVTETFAITNDFEVWFSELTDTINPPGNPYKVIVDKDYIKGFDVAGYMLQPVGLLNGKSIVAKSYVLGENFKMPDNFYLFMVMRKEDMVLIRGGTVG